MTFSASYDRATKIISACLCLVLLVIIAATHSIVVADRCIVVRRFAGPARIPLDDVREVRRAMPDDFRLSIRLWAGGGAFGYYGLFRTAKLGKCTWYVTNRNNRVVVITGSKTALFSPDDVDGFLNAIHAAALAPHGC